MNKSKPRGLRRNPTEAERTLWRHLRLRQLGGYKFRRQHPMGQYIVDFVCLEKRLVIELDGGQHSEQVAYDSERCSWLEKQGFYVLRFWNNQVLKETEAVKKVITKALGCGFETPHPDLPPQGGKRAKGFPISKGGREQRVSLSPGGEGAKGFPISSPLTGEDKGGGD